MYNENGLRVKKTVNGVVTDYTLHGKNIVHMKRGDDELHFFYDAQNRPAVVVYNGVPYAYVKSLQGDIVAILDENGNTVVSYGYDAWGAPLWCTGELAETLGKVQPFRYRGYVFDEETGLYYLRSRYYNPELSRFYGSDRIYKGNLFAYCCNQVLNTVDRNGKDAIWITDETGLSHSSVLIQDDKGDGITIIGVQPGIMVHLAARRWARMHHLVEWEMSVLYMKKLKLPLPTKTKRRFLVL